MSQLSKSQFNDNLLFLFFFVTRGVGRKIKFIGLLRAHTGILNHKLKVWNLPLSCIGYVGSPEPQFRHLSEMFKILQYEYIPVDYSSL